MTRNRSSANSASHGPNGTSAGTTVMNPSGRFRWTWLLVAIFIAALVGLYFWMSRDAQYYFTQAHAALKLRPAEADRLAQLAIEQAGGDFPAAQLLQCRALAATNQWDAALGGFSLIKNPASCDPEDLVALAEIAFKSHKFQLGEMALMAALSTERPSPRVFELLVPRFLQSGQPGEALLLCRRWQKANSKDPSAWSTAADLETQNFALGAAIGDYNEALRLDPAPELERHIRSALVQLLADTGDFAGARKQLDLVLKFGSPEKAVRLKSIQILRMEGKRKEALREIEDYIQQVEKSPEVLKQRGILSLDLGDIPSAIRDLKQVVAENDFDKDAHFKLAQAYIRSGHQELAQPHLDRNRQLTEATTKILEVEDQLRTNPDNAALRTQLDGLYKQIGRTSPSGR